jgi:hypothetical protein
MAKEAAVPDPPQTTQTPIYFPVSITKLVCLSFCSFGIYGIYWFYKNWQLERDRKREPLSPFWRALFAIFFCYPLFKRIIVTGVREGLFKGGGAGLLATLYIISNISWKLPGPYSLISLLTVLPLVMAQQIAEQINAKLAPQAPRNTRFSIANIILLALGGPLFLYGVVSAFIPNLWPS